jgi:hypothetical protein
MYRAIRHRAEPGSPGVGNGRSGSPRCDSRACLAQPPIRHDLTDANSPTRIASSRLCPRGCLGERIRTTLADQRSGLVGQDFEGWALRHLAVTVRGRSLSDQPGDRVRRVRVPPRPGRSTRTAPSAAWRGRFRVAGLAGWRRVQRRRRRLGPPRACTAPTSPRRSDARL